jgi:hypothetical protein
MDRAQQFVREFASNHSADPRHLLRRSSRSSRAIRESCNVTGIWRPVSFASPLSSTARVSSSTKSGTPPVRSITAATVSSVNAFCAATCPTIARALRALSRLSVICV